MARSKKAAGSPAKTVSGQIVVETGQPIVSAELRPALAVYNGMVAHGWTGRFPADLGAETVRGWLLEHLAFERERAHRGAATRQQRDALRETEATVKADLTRLGRLVNAYHPRGTPGRAAFYATGKGANTLGRRLAAMIRGIETSGLTSLPKELDLATLKGLLERMPKVTDEATAGGVKTGAVAATREQLDARTRDPAAPHGAGAGLSGARRAVARRLRAGAEVFAAPSEPDEARGEAVGGGPEAVARRRHPAERRRPRRLIGAPGDARGSQGSPARIPR